ncbi:sulfotransferase family protein [Marimonas arenosa]|uniref:Sulfotransferase n=1 Tax=Marimonas arenosa TaxID=1795305 RepID=A0AAE3WDW6_9RHOB|nr:sulfotransferase [Marimonas arenosa]MDQ2091456.1 sulfotransferase [Marimonas arenosa]
MTGGAGAKTGLRGTRGAGGDAERETAPAWLFCVGAQKAGTTWLYDYLSRHPEVHVPPVKELHYFNARLDPRQAGFADRRRKHLRRIRRGGAVRGLARMASRKLGLHRLRTAHNPGDVTSGDLVAALVAMHDDTSATHDRYRDVVLQGWQGEAVVADITPDYAVMPGAAFARMAEDFPNARFLFILRDPISRTWSHIRMVRDEWMRRKTRQISADEILDKLEAGGQRHILRRTSYQDTVRALRRQVGEDRLLFLFYETLFEDATIERLCAFLGVGFVAGDYEKSVRQGGSGAMSPEQRARIGALVAPVYEQVLRLFGTDVPAQWDQDMMAKARAALRRKRAENRRAQLANAG